MVYKIYSMLIILSTTAAAVVPVESDAIISPGLRDLVQNMVTVVKSKGYKCTSVSSARKMFVGNGYVLKCNHYNYTYDIENKGGKLFVTVG